MPKDDALYPSQAAWNEFADKLKEIGEKITGPTGARTARERAEGYRYLLRLISAAHELEMEADRRNPVLTRMMTPIRKFKGDGTDTLYHEAKLDESLEYRFRLRRGEDLFFSATVYAYDAEDTYYIVDHLIDDDIEWVDEGGIPTAEIALSAKRPAGAKNWVQLKGRRPILFTRQYFPEFLHHTDLGKYRPGHLTIECTSDASIPPHYDEAELAAGLRRVTDFIDDASAVSIGVSVFVGLNRIEYRGEQEGEEAARSKSMTHIRDGNIILDEESSGEHTPEELAAMIDPKLIRNNLPGPGIQYIGGWFKIEDDEAIRIAGKDVPCRYWSCQILTRYLESGDFRYHPVGINDRQISKDADGNFEIYACHTDPGTKNWVSTQGYTNGQILIRTLLADPPMEATFSVVKKSQIPASAMR